MSDASLRESTLGVSVYYLRTTFVSECEMYLCDNASATICDIEDLSEGRHGLIRQKGQDTISKEDGRIGASYIDCLHGSDNVGPATYLLNYSWGYKVKDIVESLVIHCKMNKMNEKRTYVWLCCLCLNQHRACERKNLSISEFKDTHERRASKVKNILMVLQTWDSPSSLSRIWVLFEIASAVKSNINISCTMPPSEIESMFQHFQSKFSDDHLAEYFLKLAGCIRNAKALYEQDQINITKMIESEVGFAKLCDTVNTALRQFIKAAFLFKTNEWINSANDRFKDNKDIEKDIPKGVSVHWLKHGFMQEVKNAGLSENSTINDIEDLDSPTYGVIREKGRNTYCPRDEELGAAYVDCLYGSDNVGEANLMLSYSWGNKIGEVVDTLHDYCTSSNLDLKEVYVWICCLCNNQHRINKQISVNEFYSIFHSRVVSVGHILCLMTPWNDPVYLKRVWCIFEFATALENGCDITIAMPPKERKKIIDNIGNQHALVKAFTGGKIEDADAKYTEDKERILQIVKERSGGYDHFDSTVNGKLRIWVRKTVLEEVNKWRVSGENKFLKEYAKKYPEV